MTVHRVELDKGVFAGLAAFRLPTDEELAIAGFDEPDEPTRSTRKARSRKANPTKA